MITWNDVVGVILIIMMFTLYAVFKDDPKEGLSNAGKVVDKIFDGIKRLINGIERI